mmetsp:Transcript_20273/g.60226  ORF Transcript_20273/g.60226 Transcript_20273/m.60226 type:complete len:266 (-) Transcript_20273:1325-2122(-)
MSTTSKLGCATPLLLASAATAVCTCVCTAAACGWTTAVCACAFVRMCATAEPSSSRSVHEARGCSAALRCPLEWKAMQLGTLSAASSSWLSGPACECGSKCSRKRSPPGLSKPWKNVHDSGTDTPSSPSSDAGRPAATIIVAPSSSIGEPGAISAVGAPQPPASPPAPPAASDSARSECAMLHSAKPIHRCNMRKLNASTTTLVCCRRLRTGILPRGAETEAAVAAAAATVVTSSRSSFILSSSAAAARRVTARSSAASAFAQSS